MDNIKIIKNARILTPHGFTVGSLVINDGIIEAITKDISTYKTNIIFDAQFKILIPGFVDIHTHGANGIDVNNALSNDYETLNKFFAKNGTTSYLPTIISDSYDSTLDAIDAIISAKKSDVCGSQILGIHLEGPYLCTKYKGAMPEKYLRNPDLKEFEEFQIAARGNIVHMTIAPETDGSVEFIREVTKSGVTVSIGHTDASYEQTMECIYNGADHATHTFNAMKMMHHRQPAVVGAILDTDITAEVICDGAHVDPTMVRILKKVKGVDKLVGVSDSIMATGLPDGPYRLGINDILVENGDAWLSDDNTTRAGSTLVMIDAFKNMIEFTDISISQASKIFSRNPAQVIGFDHCKGEIRIGMDADLLILDDDLNISATFVLGNLCYKNDAPIKINTNYSESGSSDQQSDNENYWDNEQFNIY